MTIAPAEPVFCHLCFKPIGDSQVGFCPDCVDRVVEAVQLTGSAEFPFSDPQRSRAVELVRSGGLSKRVVVSDGADVYAIESSKAVGGIPVWITTPKGCLCPASKPCYHQLAVLAVAALRQTMPKPLPFLVNRWLADPKGGLHFPGKAEQIERHDRECDSLAWAWLPRNGGRTALADVDPCPLCGVWFYQEGLHPVFADCRAGHFVCGCCRSKVGDQCPCEIGD